MGKGIGGLLGLLVVVGVAGHINEQLRGKMNKKRRRKKVKSAQDIEREILGM